MKYSEQSDGSGAVSGHGGFTYVVTSYRNPNQLYRLVALLRRQSPSCRIIVSHDRKSPSLDKVRLHQLAAEYLTTPRPIVWGDFSYLESLLKVVEHAELGPRDWITILSAQDYVLRPLRDFENHLSSCGADALVERPEDSAAERYLRRRYTARSFTVPRMFRKRRYGRLVNLVPGLSWHGQPHGGPPMLDVQRRKTPFSSGFHLHRGSDYFAINGSAARHLINPPAGLRSYYSMTRIPSESFPQTVLANAPGVTVRPALLHYTRWAASSHPEWLGLADLDEMLTSQRWFARKFTESDEVLDCLDDVLEKCAQSGVIGREGLAPRRV